MKTALLFCVASIVVAGCASAQKSDVVTPASAHTTSAPHRTSEASAAEAPNEKASEQTAAEKWAESKVAADGKNATAAKTDLDPLAMNDALETAAIPKIEMTPAKELRTKGRGDLDASLALVRTESSVAGAAKKLTARLGKPTWVENGTKHIWVATSGAQCHRLVLDGDGSIEVETASKNEWRMLAATASQNPCTGEIKRGLEK